MSANAPTREAPPDPFATLFCQSAPMPIPELGVSLAWIAESGLAPTPRRVALARLPHGHPPCTAACAPGPPAPSPAGGWGGFVESVARVFEWLAPSSRQRLPPEVPQPVPLPPPLPPWYSARPVGTPPVGWQYRMEAWDHRVAAAAGSAMVLVSSAEARTAAAAAAATAAAAAAAAAATAEESYKGACVAKWPELAIGLEMGVSSWARLYQLHSARRLGPPQLTGFPVSYNLSVPPTTIARHRQLPGPWP